MAAVLAPGTTRIESAACEPEIIDLCQLLVKMGARIEQIGGPELIITGVDELHGCEHTIIPDRIEAGTFICAAAITKGHVTLKGISYKYLGAFLDKIQEAELPLEISDDSITVLPYQGSLKPVDIITLPYPGFPTDLQAQMCALMSITEGISIITEKIYPNRFMHIPELQRMGADIAIEGSSAIIKGPSPFSGAPVMASDLRASAALILAGLASKNTTWVQRIYHLDRGYESFEKKLSSLGANIERLSEKDIPNDLLDT
jgi:UDP-N-acetylglucosamine 1-carboxyvinyltransferase